MPLQPNTEEPSTPPLSPHKADLTNGNNFFSLGTTEGEDKTLTFYGAIAF